MKSALRKPHGIICTQAECIWLDLPLIKKLTNIARELFPSFAYANISVPTYTCGTIGFLVCSLDPVDAHRVFVFEKKNLLLLLCSI